MVRLGVSLPALMQMMGHRDLRMSAELLSRGGKDTDCRATARSESRISWAAYITNIGSKGALCEPHLVSAEDTASYIGCSNTASNSSTKEWNTTNKETASSRSTYFRKKPLSSDSKWSRPKRRSVSAEERLLDSLGARSDCAQCHCSANAPCASSMIERTVSVASTAIRFRRRAPCKSWYRHGNLCASRANSD